MQATLFQSTPPASAPGPVLVDSQWTHLESGEPLVYLVERCDLERFYLIHRHLDPTYLTPAIWPAPPAGYGLAADAMLHDSRKQAWLKGENVFALPSTLAA